MANLDTLLKKRRHLELQIQQAAERQKRSGAILKIIERAGLADLPADVLKCELEALAERLKNAKAPTGSTTA